MHTHLAPLLPALSCVGGWFSFLLNCRSTAQTGGAGAGCTGIFQGAWQVGNCLSFFWMREGSFSSLGHLSHPRAKLGEAILQAVFPIFIILGEPLRKCLRPGSLPCLDRVKEKPSHPRVHSVAEPWCISKLWHLCGGIVTAAGGCLQDIVPTFLPHLLTTFAWPSRRQEEGNWCEWERPGAFLWP